MPGLYVAQPASRLDLTRMRPADMWGQIDDASRTALLLPPGRPPQLLFSFRGFRSHPVRNAILDRVSHPEARLTETFRWWDYQHPEVDPDRRAYLSEIRDSSFVLCPRGLAPYSHRIYETMQLGRVPVIISDEWAPPEDVPWRDFSVRIAESRIDDLP
jgi:hypothetical protein